MKVITTKEDARLKIKHAVDFAGDIVSSTLEPYGSNVLIDRKFQDPLMANDGGTVMDALELEDEIENTALKYLRGASREMTKLVGEGRSTCILLARVLYDKLYDLVKENPLIDTSMSLRNDVNDSLQKVLNHLDKNKKPISKKEEIEYIASSACENKQLGKIIAEAVSKVGPQGVVSVDEAEGPLSSFEVTEGLEIQKGMAFPSMMTDPARRRAVHLHTPVLVVNNSIKSFAEIMPIIQKVAAQGTGTMVIVADAFEGDTIEKLMFMRLQGGLPVLCVNTPGFGDKGTEEIKDLAAVVGATVKDKIEFITQLDLGYAEKVVSTIDTTVFSGGGGKEVKKRVKFLQDQVKEHDDKEWLERRIAQLSEGVGVVRVGAPTKAEKEYLKLKAEDAINATRAAIEDGVLPGGGEALANAGDELGKKDILYDVLYSPYDYIQTSAGKKFAILSNVIDPAKVEMEAIRIACSIASTLITSNAVIAIKVEDDKK